MTWKVVSENDVLAALNASETTNYRGHKATGQADPLPVILASTTEEVRGYAARQVSLDGAGVPASLVNSTLDIAIWRLAKRIQTKTEGQRKDAADAAYARLEKVAAGEIALDTDTVDPVEDPVTRDGNWGSDTRIEGRA